MESLVRFGYDSDELACTPYFTDIPVDTHLLPPGVGYVVTKELLVQMTQLRFAYEL
jgi:hypothetical protein